MTEKNEVILSERERERRAARNSYIDFLRGIAALGIVAIHTAFYAGQSYTPEWFWNITLLLDVPFFFYLSGWASSYKKSNITRAGKRLLGIWYKWVFFITVLAGFSCLSKLLPFTIEGVSSIRDLIHNYMFNVSIPGLCVVGGSIWFMPYYFVVILVNTIIMMVLQNSDREEELKKTYLWLLAVVFVWISFGKYFFGLDLTYFLFYSFFWMLGMNKMGKARSIPHLLCLIALFAVGTAFMSYVQGLPIYDLQSAKFPPTIKYGFASLITIVIAKYFDGKYQLKSNFIEHIGRNAIFYFFAQGVGSSINYYVVNAISIANWLVKWVLTYFINVVITIVIAEALAYMYFKVSHIIVRSRRKFGKQL